MARIPTDPDLETCPDYALPEHAPIRAFLISPTTTDVQAGELLKSIWTAKNDKDKVAWQLQVVTDAAELLARQQQLDADTLVQEEADRLERDTLYKEERKRNKDKSIPISLDRGLWFLTPEGLDSARRTNLHHNQNTMVVTQNDNGSTPWEPTVQPPRGIVDDEDLPWEDFCTTCPLFIKAAEDALRPSERVDMMSGLFFAVQTHPWRRSRDPLERRSLLVYAAEQRRLWHTAITANGGAYNVSIFNESILRSTHDRLYREDRKVQDAAARRSNMYVPVLVPLAQDPG
ncbi:hypothetical protein FIBSPDRAFT_825315 [Athelia psychrophila]|uniref:Uncharacterized protein n=1 Tax=Athelia psychrophila TaxID=1759441 RepID=A0A166KFH5_9AGAM|nr:hypothetical protein FIBSPDRAFT_825315 [Fibularhizoctonia sp. CBS 109695]